MPLTDADLTVCECCQQPQAIHVGYDHGKGRCLLASGWLDLLLRGRGEAEAKNVVRQVSRWYEQQAVLNDRGAGI